jgi:hypothetical protein
MQNYEVRMQKWGSCAFLLFILSLTSDFKPLTSCFCIFPQLRPRPSSDILRSEVP